MSFYHGQRLNADQPPKKQIFTRLIAWVAMFSGLLSYALPFIFGFAARVFRGLGLIDSFALFSGPVAALTGVALGILTLMLERDDTKTCRLALLGVLTGVVWFIVIWIVFLKGHV